MNLFAMIKSFFGSAWGKWLTFLSLFLDIPPVPLALAQDAV